MMSSSLHVRRSSMVPSSSLYSLRTIDVDKPSCGFLNRKTVLETSGKKSKDRTWQTFWCHVKEGKMEFFKVSGFSLKPHAEPPPKDIYPPPNRQKHKTGFVSLESSLVELDYTSQEDKDLEKRRRFLFRLILSNKMEYLFQAPSENMMLQWVTHIKRANFSTADPDLGGPSDLMTGDARIKASRCSINKKSKHNTNSVRVVASIEQDDEIDGPVSSLLRLDPRLALLRKRLQSKRELMRQLQKMLNSFSGDTECLYREAEVPSSRLLSRSGSNPPEAEPEKPLPRHSASSNGSSEGFNKITTTLLEDHYMIPGVNWSLIKKGETVEVLGRLSNGWYRCRANKDASYELEELPPSPKPHDDEESNVSDLTDPSTRDELTSTPVYVREGEEDSSLLKEISSSLGEEIIPKQLIELRTADDSKEDEDSVQERRESDEMETDGLQYNRMRQYSIDQAYANSLIDSNDLMQQEGLVSPTSRNRTESYMMATDTNPVGTLKHQSLIRKDSYNAATTTGKLVDSIEIYQTHHLSLIDPGPQRVPSPLGSLPESTSAEFELKKIRVNNILDHERANNKYIFPLVGAIPASVLQSFKGQSSSEVRPSSSTSDYVSSGPGMDESMSHKFSPGYTSSSHAKSSSFDATTEKMVSSSEVSTKSFLGALDKDASNTPSRPVEMEQSPASRQHSKRSFSLPTSSLSPLGFENEHFYCSEAPTPDLQEEEEEQEQEEYLEDDVMENEDEAEEDYELGTPRRRKSSKTLKVIPSPPSTLDRKVSASETLKHGLEAELEQVQQGKDDRSHKRSNSEDIDKRHKGFLSRIRSNLKKHVPKSPKHHPLHSAIPSHIADDLDDSHLRGRVTSISGKAMRSKGMGITFGESSSESESEEPDNREREKSSSSPQAQERLVCSAHSSPMGDRKQMCLDNDSIDRSVTPETFHEPASKTHSNPVEILKLRAKARVQSDSTEENRRMDNSMDARPRRNSFIQEATGMSGFIQAPPRGVKRQIYLDPTQKKFGFHLERFDVVLEGRTVSKTIIQHVAPGSPAFVAGFYPGDQIISVNGLDLQHASVQDTATVIQQANPNRRMEIVVAFVEGAIRVKKKQLREELQMKLENKQSGLDNILDTEHELQKSTTTNINTTHPISQSSSSASINSTLSSTCTAARDLHSWREDTPPEENSLHIFNYNRNINSILSLHHGDVTNLTCDMLVIPLKRHESSQNQDNVQDVLKAGGDGLMNELSLASQCRLGENIITKGHQLPVQAVCHSVFGTDEEYIVSCCRQALDIAQMRSYETIVFWVSGFISSYVSPHHIISAIREWLEDGFNWYGSLKVVLSVPSTPAMISLIERYFPLEDYRLHDFLQELEYVTSDEEEEEVIKKQETQKPPPLIPRQDQKTSAPPPIPPHYKPSTSTSTKPQNRTKYVHSQFSEIDFILKDIKCQVASMKK